MTQQQHSHRPWRQLHVITIGLLALSMLFGGAVPAIALEHVRFVRDGVERHVSGEAVVKAQDGGMMLRAADGVLWLLDGEEIKEVRSDEQPFRHATADEIAKSLREELGAEFSMHGTAHYLIVYNTSEAYARWCGALYERLFRAFQAYWKGKGVELSEPSGPLVALVFDSRRTYSAFAKRDLGVDPGGMIGYYNVRTNRVNMYDLTEAGAHSAQQIRQMLMRPLAERNVATIIHEATHQLAYSTGLQTRYADNPFWVSEGLAVYFETPDLRSTKGWRGIGAVNQFQFAQFRQYAPRRIDNSLQRLLTDDGAFRNGGTQADMYSEAWALNYFLLKRHPDQYSQYLAKLAARTPLITLSAEQRLADFTESFGPLPQVDQEFARFMATVR